MISETTIDGRFTNVVVTPEPGSLTAPLGIVGYGFAMCRPGDLQVDSTGRLIALGRAFQGFGRRVEAAGLAESVSIEDVQRVLNALLLTAFE